MANQACEEAIAELDGVDNESHEEALFIIEIIRDNLSVWIDGK